MARVCDNLQEFVAAIEAIGELVRVREPLSVDLEIAEVADRAMKMPGGGPALLFEQPVLRDGSVSPIPVAINLFGSWRRMALALGVDDVREHARRLEALLTPAIPDSLWGKLQLLPRLAELARVPPRLVRGQPPCQEGGLERDEVDLPRLPILKTWPGDAGPFITLGTTVTRDPDGGAQNFGLYRLQLLDRRSLALHWQRHKGGAAHYHAWKARGAKRMPVAVALGGDPTTMYTPSAPLPPGIDEALFGGFLRRKPVALARARTADLRVPAEAEIVLEGYVDLDEELVVEGPFGDHTGFYTPPDRFPRLHVTTLTHRHRPLYPATLVGRPPVEDVYLGGATERIFLPLIRLNLPEIVDLHMPPEGVFHNLVFVSIRKAYPGHAFKVMHGLWGLGLMALAKVIVVVDDGIDVQNPFEAWWYALANFDPVRDLLLARGPIDDLDHAAIHPAFGGKMGLDGTRKWPEEGATRPWPDVIAMDPAIKAKIDALWPRLGIERR